MPEMRVTRRGFLGEALAAFGFAAAGGRTLFAAPKGWKPPKGAKLVFGALSDTHLRTDYTGLKAARTFPHKYLISALEYFRSQNVDAVVHCGDAAHRGQIRELEFHAEAWNKVFPKGLAPDGHRIEKKQGFRDGRRPFFVLSHIRPHAALNKAMAKFPEAVSLFGHWFGRHYGAEERKIARLVKVIEKKQGFRDGRKPFFVLSHIRPHAALNKAMAKFPEAISLFGHWHHSASNWNVIFDWGGAVAIQVPACLPKGWLPFAHDAYITKAKLEGGEREKIGVARQGYVFRLYDDMMAIERREFGEGGSLGTDWIMPLDACKIENGKVKPHPFSREELKKVIGEPQFREGAKLVVEGGKVKIPLADGNPKCRVYAYEVAVDGELRKAVYAAGGNMGIGHETNGGVTEVEIPNQDLPAVIAVTPLSSLGTRGRPITINRAHRL